MRNAFLEAVVDTILPGERAGPDATPDLLPLPPGSHAGVVLDPSYAAQQGVLRLIAERAGGEEAFARASFSKRTELLEQVERESFAPFRALVSALVQDYYEAPSVLVAMGWREGAAQPLGHDVPQADAGTLRCLDKVRRRGRLWRPVS
ncbi:MAG: hypothetical protein JOZ30_18120 [Hyphomicrobiales bacterium]|nr:hypothetical protein [Hyphomicrobiales bacterium]